MKLNKHYMGAAKVLIIKFKQLQLAYYWVDLTEI